MSSDPDLGVLVRRTGSSAAWESPEMTSYTDEDHLQRILADAPDRVPGVSTAAVSVRELSTSAGPVDVCIVDQDASLTVVECKLATNPQRRRMVIGQVLDYASAITADGEAAFRTQWSRRGGPDLLDLLGEAGVDRLADTITEARINLCLAVDQIDADLRRLVEYLNRITRAEIRVTALQLAYARHGDLELLIPSTFGGEIAAAKAHASGRTQRWTIPAFLAALGTDADRDRAQHLLSRLEAPPLRGTHDPLWFGTAPGGGINLHPYGLAYAPLQLWIRSGDLMGYGLWTNNTATKHHDGFTDLARLLGQDHHASSRGFPLADHDLDRLWHAVTRCAEQIHTPTPDRPDIAAS